MLIPIANIVFIIIILPSPSVKIFWKQAKDSPVGLVLLSIVFWAILAFDDSVYTKIQDTPAAV